MGGGGAVVLFIAHAVFNNINLEFPAVSVSFLHMGTLHFSFCFSVCNNVLLWPVVLGSVLTMDWYLCSEQKKK